MTNAKINDFLKDAITIFRAYRDKRPLTPGTGESEAYAAYEALTEKYGEYAPGDDNMKNGWIVDFMFNGLLRELENEA